MEWPVVAGRYYVGNINSKIAVCTLASVDLLEKFKDKKYLEKIAIVGKAVTENIGIEKIVKNLVTNSNIKFLILCGKESVGHYVGQAIKALVKNGVDENKNIIGAKGPLAKVKNLSSKEIEKFRKIKIIDLIGCEDLEEIMKQVNEIEKIKEIKAFHNEKEFVQDEKGFFIILVDHDKKEIVCEHYSNDHKLLHIIKGKNAEEICATIARLNLVSRLDHAAYLGRELQKAEIALKKNLIYEQDRELEL